jgi:hypothetical protein
MGLICSEQHIQMRFSSSIGGTKKRSGTRGKRGLHDHPMWEEADLSQIFANNKKWVGLPTQGL